MATIKKLVELTERDFLELVEKEYNIKNSMAIFERKDEKLKIRIEGENKQINN